MCDNIIKNIDSMKTEERRVREREGRKGWEGGGERERERERDVVSFLS